LVGPVNRPLWDGGLRASRGAGGRRPQVGPGKKGDGAKVQLFAMSKTCLRTYKSTPLVGVRSFCRQRFNGIPLIVLVLCSALFGDCISMVVEYSYVTD
jgi:hypothetical protein